MKPFNYTQISGWYCNYLDICVASPHPTILPSYTHFHSVISHKPVLSRLTPMHQLRPPEYFFGLLFASPVDGD